MLNKLSSSLSQNSCKQLNTHFAGCIKSRIHVLADLVSARPKHRRILGETIRSYRKKVGFTQEKLAEKSDLHHNFIGEVERGNMEISIGSLIKIAKALNVDISDLVWGLH